jgi:chemotaxis response regulator CheB
MSAETLYLFLALICIIISILFFTRTNSNTNHNNHNIQMASQSNHKPEIKRIVIIGGSFGGLTCAQHLIDKLDQKTAYQITLFEPKSYFEYTPGNVL